MPPRPFSEQHQLVYTKHSRKERLSAVTQPRSGSGEDPRCAPGRDRETDPSSGREPRDRLKLRDGTERQSHAPGQALYYWEFNSHSARTSASSDPAWRTRALQPSSHLQPSQALHLDLNLNCILYVYTLYCTLFYVYCIYNVYITLYLDYIHMLWYLQYCTKSLCLK